MSHDTLPNAPRPEAAPFPDRELTQKRFSNRTRFKLRKDEFEYELKSEGHTRTFRIEYADLSTDRESLVERDAWWRNVGVIWIVLGLVMAGMAFAEHQVIRLPIWFWLGLVCYAVYQYRVTRYTIIPSERCNVYIISDATGREIVRELEARRARQLCERYDFISLQEHPDQQRHRIQWLGRQGALEDHEVSARLLQIDAMSSAQAMQQERLQREQDDD